MSEENLNKYFLAVGSCTGEGGAAQVIKLNPQTLAAPESLPCFSLVMVEHKGSLVFCVLPKSMLDNGTNSPELTSSTRAQGSMARQAPLKSALCLWIAKLGAALSGWVVVWVLCLLIYFM